MLQFFSISFYDVSKFDIEGQKVQNNHRPKFVRGRPPSVDQMAVEQADLVVIYQSDSQEKWPLGQGQTINLIKRLSVERQKTRSRPKSDFKV